MGRSDWGSRSRHSWKHIFGTCSFIYNIIKYRWVRLAKGKVLNNKDFGLKIELIFFDSLHVNPDNK